MSALQPADLRLIRQATATRKRRREPVFLAEGARVVRDLLESPLEPRLVVGASSFWDTDEGQSVADLAIRRGVQLRRAAVEEIAQLATTETPQPVFAVGAIPGVSLADLQASADARPAVVLALDAVQDPGNVGTMIRTAEALGAAGVVALPGTVDLWSPKVVRAAAGSLFRTPTCRGSVEQTVDRLREAGYAVLLADAAGAPLASETPDAVVLVAGNEGAGVRRDLFHPDDRRVSVRMRGRADSLNVAAAAAILLHQLTR